MAGLGTGAPIVKVYHEKSMILPDVSRVLTCLYEKDVKFEPCTTSYKSLLRLQASTHAPVPFYDGPTFLEESREICRYIAETYEHHGYPFLLGKDALERASIEQWLHHEEHAFNPPSRALFCHLAFPLDQEDDLEMQKAKLDEVLEVYEQRLSDSEFLAGNKFTLADLVHLPNSHYIKASGKFAYLYDSRKNVQRWWNAISTRHSWDQVLSYMTKVEQDNKLEELEKQKQQEWQREYHTATGRRTRLYSRKHTRTKSQTILVPPPDTVSASPTAPQGEQPPPADSLSEKASVFSSQSTTHKSIASPSKKNTSSTPSLGNFPSTADKPPRIHADMSSIRDVSVPPDTTETEHPTRSMLSSSKEVGTYIEPTPQKPPASLDNFSESDGPISGASHSQISPRTAKEDSDRLHASDLYRSDRKSTGHSYEATYGKSPTRGATDSSPNKLHSTEAHQMLQAEKWHAVQAGLRNLQGDIDNSVPSRQVKPSKEVQQYPSQDSEQVSIRPVAQEPLSMDGQLVQGPEGTAQTPHTDQTMGVSSPHWQHAADARRISEDEASSDRRIKGAHWSKHAADEDAQAIPFQTARDDSQDTTQRARETDSVTRSTRDQDAHDSRQGIMTYDSAPSRLQPMDASHDAPLPSKKSTSQTPYTAAHIPTGYQGAQEFIQQGRERPKPRSVVPYDAQGSTEEEKMAESPPSKAQILGSRGLDVSPPKEVLNEDGYGATGPLQTRYGDDQDDWIQARDSTTPRHMNQDAIEETEMADSEPSKARTLDSQQAFPQKQPPAEDLRFAASTSNRRYFDDQDSTKKSKHTASIPRRMEAQGSLEETKAGESGLPREQPFLQAQAKDARSLTPPSQEGYAGPQAVSKQRGDPGSISRRIRAQDARVTFVESKADDSTFTREQPSDAWQATGPLPEHKVYDAQSSTSPFQDATMKSEDTTPQQRRGQGAKETKLSDSASLQVQPSDYQRSDSHFQNQEEIEDPHGAISPHKRSYTDVEDMTKHPGDKILGEDAQDVSEETKALDSTIVRGRAHPQDTHQAAIPPRRQAATKDALGVTPHFPTRYPTAEDTSRQLRRTASTPTEKAVQDGRDAFREWKSVDSTSSREQPSDVQRAEASFPKQEEADSHSTTVPFQRRYPDIEDTTKEPIDKPKEMVGEDAQAGFEETKALDAATEPRDTPRAAITPSKQVIAKDALSVTPLPPTRYPTAEDTSRQPKRTGSTPTEKAVQDGRDAFRESKSVDSTSSTQQPSGYRRAAASLPKQEAADSRSTPLPFQRRYPDVEHTTKEPRDKPKESVGEDAQDGFDETKALDSAIIRGRAQPQETPRAAITPSKQEAAKDALSGTPLSPTRYQTAEETVGEDSQDGFEETKAFDSAIFRGRAQPQDTRRSAITPPKLEEAKDALGATPHPPTRYPTAEDTSRQPTRTASTPIEKAVPDGRDAFRELKIVDSTSSREQPSDVRRAAASLRKQEAADSHSTTVPFQRRYPDIEDTTKEPRDKPKEKVSEEAQDGFEETKDLDSSILRGRAQSQGTQRAAITPPKLDAAKDAPGATPLPPTRYPTGEDASRQPRRTASTPTEKAVRGGRDDFTESKSVDSTPSREQPSDVRRAAASLPKQEAADSRSTPLPFQRRYPDTRDTTKESRDKLKEAVGEDGQDGFEETKALDSAIIGGRAQPQETPRAAVTPSKLEGAKDALGVTPIAPTRYPTAEDTSKQSTRTASTPSEKAVPYGRDAFIESKSVDSTSSREQPSDVRRAAASLPKQEAADSRSTTMPFQRRYRDIEDTTKEPREPRDKPKETVGQDVQDTYEERVTTDSVLFTKQPSDMPRAAITPSKKAANDDAPSVSPPLPTRYPSAEDTSKQSIRPQDSRDVFREQKAVDSTSSPGPSDSLRASASLPNQEVDGTRRTTVPFQKREPELQNSTKPVNDSISTSWEMTAQDTQDTFEETKVPDSAAFSMPEVDSQRTDAEAQAEAQDTRDGGSRSRWWHASKTLPDGTPISGDDVTGLSPGDQMPTRMDQDAIPSTQIANGITERSIKQTAEPPAPVAPQTIFHQQARPSAPITKEVQASDNQGAISKIQQVSPDNHPTDYSAVPRVAAQEQVSHAPQTSPGREGITPAQREMDSPISDALPASAKVQEPAPDKSTMPFVSSVKQGSHVGHDVEPHEGPLPDTYGAVVDKETTKSLSWQDRSLEASPDSTPTHGYVHPTSRDEPAILPGQGAPQEPTHPDALDSASTRDVTADSLVGPKKFKQRSTDQEDISFASNQTSGMGAQPYSSLDKVARAEQKSDLSDQDPSHSAQETVLAAAERTKALPKPIDQQETPDSRKPPTPDTQYASQIIPSQEKVAPDVPSQEKVSQAELSLKPHEGSTPHMHGSIVDEKKTRPLASPTKSSNDVLDLTPAGADVHPTSSTEPPRSALPVQAQTPSATQTPPPFASHKSVRTEDIRADANGKVKSVKPSASPDAPHATAPGEVALSEQKLASAGRDSSRAAQLPSSDEPRNEQIKDSDHTAQPFSSAAPDQAKDLQRTFGQPDISRAPGTSESPYSDVYDGARKVDPDYQLIDKTIPSQEQVSHPDLASKTNEGPTETPGPAPLMDVYDSISTQYIQDGDLDKDQDSANFAQKYSSSEPKEEESTVAAPDQTKEIQTTVGQQDILPAVSKEKDPSSGVQYDSMEVQEVAPKDQHIDGSIPSHEQAPNVEEPMTHITGPTSALDTQHGMTSDQDSYQYPELPSSAKSRKETDVAEADKTKAKQMTFGQPVPVPSDATRSVTDQGAQQPQRPAKIESPPFLETIKNYEYTQNVSDETLDKNKSSGKPSADQEVMSPKVVPATFLDPQRVTVPDDEQKIAKPDLTRSAQPPFSAEPTKRKTVVGASDQAKASETIVDREGQEHGSFSEGSTTDSRDAITDESATTSTSGSEKVLDASILTATHDDAHPPTVRNLPEHETQAPASTQSASVEASDKAKSTDQEDMKPMASQASILDTQRGTNGDKPIARFLHDQGAQSPELTHPQQPPESPPHSASQHDAPTDVLDKTKMTKLTSTNQEGMAPTAGSRSTLESQPDGTFAAEVVHDEQKSTLSDQESARATQPLSSVERSKEDTNVSAADQPEVPQTIFHQKARSSVPVTREVQFPDSLGAISKIQEVSPDNQSTDYSAVQPVPTKEQVLHAPQTSPDQEGITPAQGEKDSPIPDAQLVPHALQDKGSPRSTQPPPPIESSEKESQIAEDGQTVLLQSSVVQESTPSLAGPRESSSSDSPYPSAENQVSTPKEVEPLPPTTGMMDRVQPSSEATPGVVAGISATPGDNQPSPDRESVEVAEEGTDQQKADQASVQSPQDNMGQVKETEEQDTGTGETYQATVQSPQDIKEQRDETEQQDTRTGEAYQDAPAPDAPQDKGSPRSTQPPPPVESSQKESKIAEDSQTLLPQASAVQESTPSSAGPREFTPYPSVEDQGSAPKAEEPLPPTTGMMDRVQPSSEATPGVVAGISATPGDNQPSPARESAEVAKEGTGQQKADQASVQSPQDNMGQVKETEEQDTGTGETYQASVQSPQDIKEQRDETEQQDTRTGEAYQDAPAPDAPQDKGSPRSTQPPPPVESSQKESKIAEDSQTLLPQASAVQESTPSSAGPRESTPYPSVEDQGSAPKAEEPLPPTTGMMDRVQPSSEATPGVVAGISATPGDNQPSPARESAEVAKEGTDQQKADQASVQSPQDNMDQVKETEEQDTGTGETYQASVQSPQDIKEQRDETEQQDTRTGEAYQDAPAPDAPQDKGLPRSTQPPPPIESSQKESEIAEDSQTLLPQASAVQESTPSSASPRDSLSLDSSYSLMENRGSVPNVGKPLPPSTDMMDRVQPSLGPSLEVSSDEKTTVPLDGLANNLSNVSPSVTASQVLGRSENGSGTGALSGETVPSNSQENSEGTPSEEISKQQPQTNMSSTKLSKDDNKEADGSANDTKPGDSEDNPSR
nr:mucin-5AC isoform X5 [Oryza sativa Japonica Group]